MKHLERKSVTDENGLSERLPVSSTPSLISCASAIELDGHALSPQPATSSTEQGYSRLAVFTIRISVTKYDAALQAMKGLAQANVDVIRTPPYSLWRAPCQVVQQLTWVQYYLNLDRGTEACASYDKALGALQHRENLSCMSALQLVLYLFAWTIHENTITTSKKIFEYLAEAGPTIVHPILATIAKAFVVEGGFPLLYKISFLQVLCDVFERGLEPQSSMLFWVRIRLCRSLFIHGEIDGARTLFEHIKHERERTGHLVSPSLLDEIDRKNDREIDREIAATSHLFGDLVIAKRYLKGVLNHWSRQDDDYGSKLVYFCNNWLPATPSSRCMT